MFFQWLFLGGSRLKKRLEKIQRNHGCFKGNKQDLVYDTMTASYTSLA